MMDLVAMARAAEKDERLSDGALCGKLANEVVRLRELLTECAEELAGYIHREYDGTLKYPMMRRRYERDMDIVERIRRVLPPPPRPQCRTLSSPGGIGGC